MAHLPQYAIGSSISLCCGDCEVNQGEDIVAFVTLEGNNNPSEELSKELKKHVVQEIGAIARPLRNSLY